LKTALVLSGGGMFGAWQAGAWLALADRLRPDLIVGASVGCLNGYAIAGGATPQQLIDFWMQPDIGALRSLPVTIQSLMLRHPLNMPYAVVLTDLLRLKPRIFSTDLTWQHLAASCAIPGVLPQYKIGARWYTDGGLLNPLPVWAAIELGATRIVALHVLPEIPSSLLKPFVKGFRRVAGHNPPLPDHVSVTILKPDHPLGSVTDALRWQRDNIHRWIGQGNLAAKNISLDNCS
jgi:predicted acylesterase/phospholipase RssA